MGEPLQHLAGTEQRGKVPQTVIRRTTLPRTQTQVQEVLRPPLYLNYVSD